MHGSLSPIVELILGYYLVERDAVAIEPMLKHFVTSFLTTVR